MVCVFALFRCTFMPKLKIVSALDRAFLGHGDPERDGRDGHNAVDDDDEVEDVIDEETDAFMRANYGEYYLHVRRVLYSILIGLYFK